MSSLLSAIPYLGWKLCNSIEFVLASGTYRDCDAELQSISVMQIPAATGANSFAYTM